MTSEDQEQSLFQLKKSSQLERSKRGEANTEEVHGQLTRHMEDPINVTFDVRLMDVQRDWGAADGGGVGQLQIILKHQTVK